MHSAHKVILGALFLVLFATTPTNAAFEQAKGGVDPFKRTEDDQHRMLRRVPFHEGSAREYDVDEFPEHGGGPLPGFARHPDWLA